MPTEENEPLRPPLQQPPASGTPRKMKFLQVMADHTGDKLKKRASQNRAQTSVPLRDWSTKTPKRDKSANQNEKEEPPESAEKKKKVSEGNGEDLSLKPPWPSPPIFPNLTLPLLTAPPLSLPPLSSPHRPPKPLRKKQAGTSPSLESPCGAGAWTSVTSSTT